MQNRIIIALPSPLVLFSVEIRSSNILILCSFRKIPQGKKRSKKVLKEGDEGYDPFEFDEDETEPGMERLQIVFAKILSVLWYLLFYRRNAGFSLFRIVDGSIYQCPVCYQSCVRTELCFCRCCRT